MMTALEGRHRWYFLHKLQKLIQNSLLVLHYLHTLIFMLALIFFLFIFLLNRRIYLLHCWSYCKLIRQQKKNTFLNELPFLLELLLSSNRILFTILRFLPVLCFLPTPQQKAWQICQVIDTVSGSKMRLVTLMQNPKTKFSARPSGIFRLIDLHLLNFLLKMPSQTVNIFLILLNSMMLQLLFLINHLLVIVSVPEIIVATDMVQNLSRKLSKLRGSCVAERQFDQIILKMVLFKSEHLFWS
jgi:hypothetical protein